MPHRTCRNDQFVPLHLANRRSALKLPTKRKQVNLAIANRSRASNAHKVTAVPLGVGVNGQEAWDTGGMVAAAGTSGSINLGWDSLSRRGNIVTPLTL